MLLLVAAVLGFRPGGPHAYHSLSEGHGEIRWAGTVTDTSIQPPLAPGWILRIRGLGVPWPADQPLEPTGAAFASDGLQHTAAWYVIRSRQPSLDLWHLDKESVRLRARGGSEIPWGGGSGSVLIDSARRLQYLYMEVPADHSRTGATVTLRLSRFSGERTEPVRLPF